MGGSTAGVEGVVIVTALISVGIAFVIVRAPVIGQAVVGAFLLFLGVSVTFGSGVGLGGALGGISGSVLFGIGAVLCGIAGAVRAFRPPTAEQGQERQREDIY